MQISTVINQMLILLILLIVGVVARKTNITDDDGNRKLSRLLLNVCQSAMIIAAVLNNDEEFSLAYVGKVLGVSVLLYALLVVLAYFVPLVFAAKKENRGTYRFMSIFGNVGFMGFPVIASIFGSNAVFYASLFNIPFNLLLYTLGIFLISEGRSETNISWKTFVNPPLVSTVVALLIFLFRIRVPSPLASAIDLLGDMVVPAAMIVIGTSLGSMSLRKLLSNWRLYIFSPIKLILLPAIVWFIFHFFVKDPMILGIATVMASLPVATNGTMLCLEYGGNEELASSGIFITTVLSVITIPLMVWLLLA